MIRRLPRLALGAALLASVAWQDARACTCCTSPGERTDLVMPLDSFYADELSKLRFEPAAELFLGEAEPDMVKGILNAAATYTLQAAWKGDRMDLAFRDAAGHSGALSVARPRNVSTFHVDPRAPDGGRSPALYKEWRLTAKAAGSGIFRPSLGPNQTLTLVLQGRGNNCTSADQFTHWMLVMWGPKAKYHFFGSLKPL